MREQALGLLCGGDLADATGIMKKIFVVAVTVFLALGAHAGELEQSLRKDAQELLAVMSPERKKLALFPLDHENRWQMRFTGGERPGVTLSFLEPAARKVVDRMISRVLSPYGLQKANEVAAQDDTDIGRLSLAIFGDPAGDGEFVWRVGEHHFTIVNVVIKGGELTEFGPVLLGSNPYGPWDAEEASYVKLFQAAKGEIPVLKGKAISTQAMKTGAGVRIGDLGAVTREALDAAIAERLKLFTPEIEEQLEKAAGSLDDAKIAFYSENPTKSGKDGGRWDVKIGSPKMVFDLELSRGHNHMSVWVKP